MNNNIKEIKVASAFHHRLANRNKFQGDGKHHAVDFRKKYLDFLDNEVIWNNDKVLIYLNFDGVTKIGPSFANEAFAYFMKYTNPERFLQVVRFKNISEVQMWIIEMELKTGFDK